MRWSSLLPPKNSASSANALDASINCGSFKTTSACNGVFVLSRLTVQTSRDGASRISIEVGGADRFQNQYMLLRYRSAPVLASYFFVSLSGMATAFQTPSGWYGLTLGPPTFWTSRPLAAKAVSRIISASMRNRGPRESKRLSRSLTNFSGVAVAACR